MFLSLVQLIRSAHIDVPSLELVTRALLQFVPSFNFDCNLSIEAERVNKLRLLFNPVNADTWTFIVLTKDPLTDFFMADAHSNVRYKLLFKRPALATQIIGDHTFTLLGCKIFEEVEMNGFIIVSLITNHTSVILEHTCYGTGQI